MANIILGGTTSDLQAAVTKLQSIATVLLDTSRALNTFGIVNDKIAINTLDYALVTFSVNSKSHTMTCYANKQDGSYAATWGYGIDSTFVEWIVQFDTAGRYLTNTKAYRSINRGTWQELTASMNITRIVGFTFF